VGQHGGPCAAAPLRSAGTRGQRSLIDAAVERRCERTGHCARTTGAWASEPALRALLGTALAPLSQGRIGTVEGRGDGREVLARHHLTDGVGPTKAPGLLGLCESGLSGRHGRSGKWAVEGAHRFPPGGIKKFIQHGTNGETLLIGTMGLRLKFCSFCSLSVAGPLQPVVRQTSARIALEYGLCVGRRRRRENRPRNFSGSAAASPCPHGFQSTACSSR
jgi:hypothetical protein